MHINVLTTTQSHNRGLDQWDFSVGRDDWQNVLSIIVIKLHLSLLDSTQCFTYWNSGLSVPHFLEFP